jgi:hypothetical protein
LENAEKRPVKGTMEVTMEDKGRRMDWKRVFSLEKRGRE